ncbi:MAG: LacI family transcriptional regulator [Herbinix sp.]|jgi:LacI family transcriptional regulator|nr:LacI family transcriptional regulator [Herbinix sp.]
MNEKVTMKDVARRAGVSAATVSNVLNNVGNRANELTQRKVLKAAKELNYQMDMTARFLSTGKSNLIGIFLPEVYEIGQPSSVLKDNPFFSEIISGIEYVARMNGYDIVVSCIKESGHVKELVSKRTLDGIAVLGNFKAEFWEELRALEIPKVLIDSYQFDEQEYSNVGIDDEQGAYLATKHLITMNHKEIALVTGKIEESEVNYYRYLGFQRAIVEENLSLEKCPVVYTDVNFKGGVAAAHSILYSHSNVTAAFAVADILALGIIKLYNQIGKAIPKDLSLIGFDDLSICQYTFPGLTTIRQDINKKGMEVANILIHRINGDTDNCNIQLPVELVLRQTVLLKQEE